MIRTLFSPTVVAGGFHTEIFVCLLNSPGKVNSVSQIYKGLEVMELAGMHSQLEGQLAPCLQQQGGFTLDKNRVAALI